MATDVQGSPSQTSIATTFSRTGNLGPLTTAFRPPSECQICYEEAKLSSTTTTCLAYSSGCNGVRTTCMPPGWDSEAFYSPGLSCPVGWTTATAVEPPGLTSIILIGGSDTLTPDESAAACCPM